MADIAWLRQNLNDPNLRIVAFVPANEYQEGHIPGAAQIDWPELEFIDSSPAAIERWREQAQRLIGNLGISRDSKVVVYDNGSLWAARLWWILHQFDHAEKRVLDGGLAAWRDAGGEISTEKPTITPVEYQGTPQEEPLATLPELRARVDQPGIVIVDARSAEEYRAGHIPGAVNVNYPMNGTGGTPNFWRQAEELLEMYRLAGVTPDKTVIAYCSTGVRSAVTYFTLKMLGYPNVELYSASWAEWGQNPDLPKETGPGS